MDGRALWSGRFAEGMDDDTLWFTSSLDVDSALAFYDIMGSLAHARMLGECGIISSEDTEAIVGGLKDILALLEGEELEVDGGLEDIHTNIEVMLTGMIGPAGGRLHTGRSRNDQVAADYRMYLRDTALDAVTAVGALARSLLEAAEGHRMTVMPGFTHLQHAQPVSLAQHLLAHVFRLERDADRFMDALARMDRCPLGAAALAGTTYPIDREMTAAALGFAGPTENSMDTVSSRDNVAELAFCAAMTAVDLSSLCEELVLWSSQEFGFVEMDDRYTTGSSIMPQKKNPDIAELVRGRSGRAVGNLVSMLVMLKGLPLSYNRDLQEDKRPLMESLDTVTDAAAVLARVVATASFDAERMLAATVDGFINATDLADHLVTRGVPFREAHGIVGAAVRHCIDAGKRLEELTLEEFNGFGDGSAVIGEEIYALLTPEACVARRDSYGGTSPSSTAAQIALAAERLEAREAEVAATAERIGACWAALTR